MNIKPPQLTLQLRPWSLLLQTKEKYSIFKKHRTFSVLIYSYIRVEIGKTRNFTQFRVFPIFTSVDITVYQYGKNVLYFFYNIAQRTLTEEWREIFRVDIILLSYINTALSQSAFRIYKCYIMIYISSIGQYLEHFLVHTEIFPYSVRAFKIVFFFILAFRKL